MRNRIPLLTITPLVTGLLLFGQSQAQEPDVDGAWIQPLIDTSGWTPPSPDPSGLAYDPVTDRLISTDGEVDEMPIFNNANLFEATTLGVLQATANTTAYTNEPVGTAFNPVNGHLFISDDVQRKVFEIDPGNDGQLHTADDIRTSFSTSAFGSNDPEGLAFGGGALYIADGSNAEVYKVTPAGVLLDHFDTESQGILDPEGIEFEAGSFPGGDRLYVAGEPVTRVAQMYAAGPLLRYVNITAPNPDPVKPAGLAVGPGSPGNLFVAARGVDNDTDPNENDGKIYEFSVAALSGNLAPAVAVGPDQVILDGTAATLDGTVVDEGSVTTGWTQVSGPGTATFTDPSAVDTTATFTAVGDYVLQLTADDGARSETDEITVTVQPLSPPVKTVYVSTQGNGIAGGISYKDEDILKCVYDAVAETCAWSMFADFSDINVGGDIDAFHLLPPDPVTGLPSILFSLGSDTTMSSTGKCMPGVTVDDSDIIRFIPSSLGSSTDGTCEWYFDASDVELTTSDEDVDAIGLTPDGKLVISTTSSPVVTCPGCPSLKDEDLLVFTGSTGEETSGTWAIHFDGSDVNLSTDSSEDVNETWIDALDNIYLTTKGAFSVTGASGDGADVFRCRLGATGGATSCNYNFTWDGINSGLLPPSGSTTPPVVDGLDLEL